MERLDEVPTLEGGDHGGSVALADGRRMFVYGDTIRDAATVTPFMVRNSVLIVDDGCLTPMDGPTGAAAIPDDSDDTGYWPMSLRALKVTGGTKVHVITNRVREAGSGSFQTLGSSLATFEIPAGRTPRLAEQVPLAADSSGWSLHVARTAPDALADTDGWEYCDGTRWVAGAPDAAQSEAAQLIPADQGVSGIHRYTPLAHPDFTTPSGRLLVSSSESPTNHGLYHTNPEQYRPRFAEVTLP